MTPIYNPIPHTFIPSGSVYEYRDGKPYYFYKSPGEFSISIISPTSPDEWNRREQRSQTLTSYSYENSYHTITINKIMTINKINIGSSQSNLTTIDEVDENSIHHFNPL